MNHYNNRLFIIIIIIIINNRLFYHIKCTLVMKKHNLVGSVFLKVGEQTNCLMFPWTVGGPHHTVTNVQPLAILCIEPGLSA